MTSGTVMLIAKYAIYVFSLMAIICVVAILTPKAARFIDKRFLKKKPEAPAGSGGEEEYKVKGPYDAQRSDGFDPNYKIYNEDIYGFNKSKRKGNKENGKKE